MRKRFDNPIQVRIPNELRTQLADSARRCNLTLSDVVRLALDQALDEWKRDRRIVIAKIEETQGRA